MGNVRKKRLQRKLEKLLEKGVVKKLGKPPAEFTAAQARDRIAKILATQEV